MFYEELYAELGKLFYYIAAVDGKVVPAEKESLQKLIKKNWKPLESSVDQYGTDQANLIDFAFDYEESESVTDMGLQSFNAFYEENKRMLTPSVVDNILQTADAIAGA